MNKYDNAAYLGLIQPLQVLATARNSISMDFIEGLPTSKGKSIIWVVTDRLTKYAHFVSFSHPYTVADIAKLFMENVYRLHGMSIDILGDRDAIFTNKLWQELFSIQRVILSISTAYHPQSDGQSKCNPYETLYGQSDPLHLPYMDGNSELEVVESDLTTQKFKFQLLKHHLTRAQQRMIPRLKHTSLIDNFRFYNIKWFKRAAKQ